MIETSRINFVLKTIKQFWVLNFKVYSIFIHLLKLLKLSSEIFREYTFKLQFFMLCIYFFFTHIHQPNGKIPTVNNASYNRSPHNANTRPTDPHQNCSPSEPRRRFGPRFGRNEPRREYRHHGKSPLKRRPLATVPRTNSSTRSS